MTCEETKKVNLRVLSMSGGQPLHARTATGRPSLAIIGAVAQAEREAMLKREREVIAKAKAEGRYRALCRPFDDRLPRSSRPSQKSRATGNGRPAGARLCYLTSAIRASPT